MRFPEFNGVYNVACLSNYLFENKNRNKDLSYNKNDVLSVSGEYGIVNQIELQGRSFAGESVKDYHIVEANDIVYTKSPLKANPYGIIKVNKGCPGIVSTLYAVYHVKNNACPKYVDYYFANDLKLNKFLKPLVNIGAKHDMKVNNETVLNGIVVFPSFDEQEKIVTFLSLIDERIEKQRQLVDALKRYKRGVINKILASIKQTDMVPLKDLVKNGHVKLGRGNVIPKYKKDESKTYPVYSSSTHNDGLMGFYDTFMFDDELITWSIDGGGNFFYRKKHKFNVTNVCGILELDTTQYNYKFIAECLIHQHERKHFDYLSKAHPSVIIDMYKLPNISVDVQQKYATLFLAFDDLIIVSEQVVANLRQVKTALLQQMFI